MKARFQIENVIDTQPALPAHAVFSQRGGLIGSGGGVTWQIQDLDNSIPETAARIVVEDGHFTLEALSDAPIRINDARDTIPVGRPVILSDRDRLRIGSLDITVAVPGEMDGHIDDAQEPVDHLVNAGAKGGDGLIINGEYAMARDVDDTKADAKDSDPVAALEQETAQISSDDPLDAFAVFENHGKDKLEAGISDAVRNPALEQGAREMADGADMHFASMPNSTIFKDRYGFEETVSEGLDSHLKAPPTDLNDPVDHIALRPLARRLGIHIGEMSTEEAARLLGDIGGSLRAALAGLNRIYRDHGQRSGNFPLATMHLHALEDNPVRFSPDTDSALHAFFSKRGPVHLSAPAAVAETLEHLHTHQGAVEKAVNEALDSVLAALSPKALERRFKAYEHTELPENSEAYAAWCWRMYRAYFTELRSERQRGLQMLFWEIFAQEYQVEMRRVERLRDAEDTDSKV